MYPLSVRKHSPLNWQQHSPHPGLLYKNSLRGRYVDFLEQGPGLPPAETRESVIQAAGVPEVAMRVFLDGVEQQYGGPLQYLSGIGIDDDQQLEIREALLER